MMIMAVKYEIDNMSNRFILQNEIILLNLKTNFV